MFELIPMECFGTALIVMGLCFAIGYLRGRSQ